MCGESAMLCYFQIYVQNVQNAWRGVILVIIVLQLSSTVVEGITGGGARCVCKNMLDGKRMPR